MYRQIEKEMRRAVRAGRLVLRTHVRKALKDENFEVADVVHCLMHGDIVADQYDPDEDDLKYEWRGEARDGREIALITKFTYTRKVFVITVFWLELSDYY